MSNKNFKTSDICSLTIFREDGTPLIKIDDFPSDRINITSSKNKSLLDKIKDGDDITNEDVYGNQDGLEPSDTRRR